MKSGDEVHEGEMDELWSAEEGIERFSLYADGLLYSEHFDCGVRLTAPQIQLLASAANTLARKLGKEAP